MISTQSEKEKEGKEMKEKQFLDKSRRTTTHASLREEENADINQMIQWNHNHNHQIQPHTPSEGGNDRKYP
jgi:hypothetical protein